ncbi:MAG: putative zinc-binding protein [Desulforhopalus sp.]
MQHKIVILPCKGDSAAGHLTWIVAQELVLEEKAQWYSEESQTNRPSVTDTVESKPFIILDGCDRRCLFNALLDKGLVGEHQLALTDVGIEPMYVKDITRNDIELAKDAVMAECTSVDTMKPPLFSKCCCK